MEFLMKEVSGNFNGDSKRLQRKFKAFQRNFLTFPTEEKTDDFNGDSRRLQQKIHTISTKGPGLFDGASDGGGSRRFRQKFQMIATKVQDDFDEVCNENCTRF